MSKIERIIEEINNQKAITCSWGVKEIEQSVDSLCFIVEGFKYQGKITITIIDDRCVIHFDHTDENFELDNIANLVEYLDRKIELTNDYVQDVTSWLKELSK